MILDTIYNQMLDLTFRVQTGTDRLYVSIHTAYDVAGGNMHGSKIAAQWNPCAARIKAMTAPVDFPITAPVTIKWVGFWGGTSGDTFQGMVPNDGGDRSFQIDATANERIYCEGHGLANDDKVVFHNDTAPGGLTAGTTYWVVGVTAGDPDYFQVSSTQGGGAINLTAEPGPYCVVSKIVETSYASDGTHRVSALAVSV